MKKVPDATQVVPLKNQWRYTVHFPEARSLIASDNVRSCEIDLPILGQRSPVGFLTDVDPCQKVLHLQNVYYSWRHQTHTPCTESTVLLSTAVATAGEFPKASIRTPSTMVMLQPRVTSMSGYRRRKRNYPDELFCTNENCPVQAKC